MVKAVAEVGGAATAVAADLLDPGAVQGLVDRAMSGRVACMTGVLLPEPVRLAAERAERAGFTT